MESKEKREIALKVGVLVLVGVLISVAGYGYSRSRFREHATEQAETAASRFAKATSWTSIDADADLVEQWGNACSSVQTPPTEKTADARGHLEKVRIISTELTETGATVELTPDGGQSVFTLAVDRSGKGKDEKWHVTGVTCEAG
ncbi:hypothetical protein WBG06_24905 [Nocardioides sp. CCNWLW239]|uniref:hypothetical protein n=1 Tax=Nocardioides sp. CCNWLW239 TaxID=3128902 RepID=UPI0030189067